MIQGAETTLYGALSQEMKTNSGAYLEDSAIKEPSKISQDKDDQKRLWDLTGSLLAPWITVDQNDLKSL